MEKICVNWRACYRVLLCLICVICVICSCTVDALAAGAVRVSGSAVSAEKGEEVTVTFKLSNNPGIWGLKGQIIYDQTAFTLKSVSAGTVFDESELTGDESLSKNPYAFLAVGNAIANKTNDGVVLTLVFTVNSKADLGTHIIEILITQAINVDGDDITISTAAAEVTLVECMHRNTRRKNVKAATEESEGYSGDVHCTKCGVMLEKGTTIPKLVNTCKHQNVKQTTLVEATCTTNGKAKTSCSDCGKELQEVAILATGHTAAPVTNWKAATTTEEGYTGDTYCADCNELLETGTVIPKIPIYVFNMTVPAGDTYERGGQTGLVFVSDADVATFVRVEVDGKVLSADDFTVESGSTKITLKPAYLETLADGKHTVTIVSDAGTAAAQFSVETAQNEPDPTEPEPTDPEPSQKDDGKHGAMLLVTIVSVTIAAACIAYIVITEIRRNKEEELDNDEE